MAENFLEVPLGDFLDQVAAATPAPGAGAVAATSVALAAALTAMSAGLSSRHLAEAPSLRTRALELKEQVQQLAQRDADAYAAVLAAQALPADDPKRPATVHAALSDASDVPLQIAGLGAEVIDLAFMVAQHGNPNLHGDALTACLMAQAGVRAASALVELNLSDAGDPRRERAARLADRVCDVPLSPPPSER